VTGFLARRHVTPVASPKDGTGQRLEVSQPLAAVVSTLEPAAPEALAVIAAPDTSADDVDAALTAAAAIYPTQPADAPAAPPAAAA
jgi:hypothetical protein